MMMMMMTIIIIIIIINSKIILYPMSARTDLFSSFCEPVFLPEDG
jgi:hypothetical protein